MFRGVKAGYKNLSKQAGHVSERLVEAIHVPEGGLRVIPQSGSSTVDRITQRAGGHKYVIEGRAVQEVKQINEGGFAFVWTARDLDTKEALALKKIVVHDKKALEMAHREVDLLRRLPPHPNLIRYYGCTEVGEQRVQEVVLLFELCTDGHILDFLERKKGDLGEETILDVFSDVSNAVALLHTLSPPIQHRDLKVENVLLGSNGKFKLCDFGSWSDECLDPSTMSKQELGQLRDTIDRYTTMMYRPPEMVDFYQNFLISEKVDLWMLGCILFTLMFYQHPFQDESSLAISNARYRMPGKSRYTDKLQDLTHWLLARDPGQRPTARQVVRILEGFKLGDDLALPEAVIQVKAQHRRLYDTSAAPSLSEGGHGSEHGAHNAAVQLSQAAGVSPSVGERAHSDRRGNDKLKDKGGERDKKDKTHKKTKRPEQVFDAFAVPFEHLPAPWGAVEPPTSAWLPTVSLQPSGNLERRNTAWPPPSAPAQSSTAEQPACAWPPAAMLEPSPPWASFDAFGAAGAKRTAGYANSTASPKFSSPASSSHGGGALLLAATPHAKREHLETQADHSTTRESATPWPAAWDAFGATQETGGNSNTVSSASLLSTWGAFGMAQERDATPRDGSEASSPSRSPAAQPASTSSRSPSPVAQPASPSPPTPSLPAPAAAAAVPWLSTWDVFAAHAGPSVGAPQETLSRGGAVNWPSASAVACSYQDVPASTSAEHIPLSRAGPASWLSCSSAVAPPSATPPASVVSPLAVVAPVPFVAPPASGGHAVPWPEAWDPGAVSRRAGEPQAPSAEFAWTPPVDTVAAVKAWIAKKPASEDMNASLLG